MTQEEIIKTVREVDEIVNEVLCRKPMRVDFFPHKFNDKNIYSLINTGREVIISNIKYMRHSN
jgi:hypothetical protein